MELDIFETGTLKVLLENQLEVTEGLSPIFETACKELYNKLLTEENI